METGENIRGDSVPLPNAEGVGRLPCIEAHCAIQARTAAVSEAIDARMEQVSNTSHTEARSKLIQVRTKSRVEVSRMEQLKRRVQARGSVSPCK